MRISDKKQLNVGSTYFYVTYQFEVRRFEVTKIGRKYIYAGDVRRDIEDNVFKNHWFDNVNEATEYSEDAKKIRIVRGIFNWKNTHLLTYEECIEFFEKYGDRIKQ